MDSATMSTGNRGEAPAKRRRKSVGKLRRRMLTLANLDGRTIASKRAAQLIRAITMDITAGDPDAPTEAQRQLVQRAAILGALIEADEASWLNGDIIDLQTFFAAIGLQRRLLESIGLQRRARDVETLDAYLARAHQPEQQQHQDDVTDAEIVE